VSGGWGGEGTATGMGTGMFGRYIYLGFELMGLHRWAESMAGLELGSFG